MSQFKIHDGAGWKAPPLKRWVDGAWRAAGQAAPTPAEPAPASGIPATSDTTIQALRPTGRSLATYTVGPTGNYATISAAVEAAKAAQKSAGKQTSIAWNGDGKDIGPDYRVDIIIAAGTYNEAVGSGSWINFYGATGNPADVKITSNATDGGTVHTWGPTYVEGITIESTQPTSGTGQKYPLHLTGGGNTTVIASCRIVTTNTVATGSGAAIGMDGADGSYTLFYKTGITAISGGAAATNAHGFAGNTMPLDLVFVDCTSTGTIKYDALSATADRLYWIGGSTPGITVTGSGTVTTVDPAATTGTVAAPNIVSGTAWPQATGGRSSRDEAFFYPSKIGTALDVTPTVTDAAPMTVVANRVYYVPITITEALHLTGAGVDVTTASGQVQTHREVQRGGTVPTGQFLNPGGTTLTVGKVYEPFYYFKDVYPGDGRVWVRMRFTAAAQVKGSANLPGTVDCYYEDQPQTLAEYTPNLIKVASGTPVPLPFIRAAA